MCRRRWTGCCCSGTPRTRACRPPRPRSRLAAARGAPRAGWAPAASQVRHPVDMWAWVLAVTTSCPLGNWGLGLRPLRGPLRHYKHVAAPTTSGSLLEHKSRCWVRSGRQTPQLKGLLCCVMCAQLAVHACGPPQLHDQDMTRLHSASVHSHRTVQRHASRVAVLHKRPVPLGGVDTRNSTGAQGGAWTRLTSGRSGCASWRAPWRGERARCLGAEPCPAFFAFFRSQKDAAFAAQTRLHPEDGHCFCVTEAPGPDEVGPLSF